MYIYICIYIYIYCCPAKGQCIAIDTCTNIVSMQKAVMQKGRVWYSNLTLMQDGGRAERRNTMLAWVLDPSKGQVLYILDSTTLTQGVIDYVLVCML